VLLACGLLAADEKTAAAEKAAASWLALVDAGRYGESWEEAAGLFKAKVPKEKWEAAMNAGRKPLGALKTRKLLGAKHTTEVPGAPAGEYVVVQYSASFEDKDEAVETVTPTLDKDGNWRVSGYFIR
jgi:hypothetical protein